MWLVGAGPMAQAYGQVLRDLEVDCVVIGRGAASAEKFTEAVGLPVVSGGLDRALELQSAPASAIVSTPVDALAPNCHALIAAGAKRILVEKPAGLNPEEIRELANAADSASTEVFVAYNRRFYASVLKARELIEADGGPTSLRLEFSEFSYRIADAPTPAHIKQAWLYANSTHVLDMGFFMAGFPLSLSSASHGALDWHPGGAQFVGHGVTDRGAPFSYSADWQAAPRWMVEIGTKGRTIMFQPLEKLKFREWTGFAETQVELDNDLDTRFKPGLWKQTEAFANGRGVESGLCFIAQHADHMETVYQTILKGGSSGS